MSLPLARPRLRRAAKPAWREWLEAVLFSLIVTTFLLSGVRVSGASMMPGLRDQEVVLIPKVETWLHRAGLGDYSRGDVLVFKPPAAAPDEWRPAPLGLWRYRPYLIKRLVGLPGDRIRVSGGQVWVNGQPLDARFTTAYWQQQGCWDTRSDVANHAQTARYQSYTRDLAEFTVPAGQYYLMGDNRSPDGSYDSRALGPVLLRDVAGRAALSVWPLVRRADTCYDCAYRGPHAPDAVTASGRVQFSPRLLSRPAGFGALR